MYRLFLEVEVMGEPVYIGMGPDRLVDLLDRITDRQLEMAVELAEQRLRADWGDEVFEEWKRDTLDAIEAGEDRNGAIHVLLGKRAKSDS